MHCPPEEASLLSEHELMELLCPSILSVLCGIQISQAHMALLCRCADEDDDNNADDLTSDTNHAI